MSRIRPFRRLAGLLACVLTAGALAGAAVAGPPPWAPAHGYRAKHGLPPAAVHQHGSAVQETQVYYPQDLDIHLGRCNRDLMGSLLAGELAGALATGIGGEAGNGLAGEVLGLLLGGTIGRAMDPLDQQCVAQALEAAGDHDRVTWENPGTGTWYRLTPQQTYLTPRGRVCRDYLLEAEDAGDLRQTLGQACRDDSGRWAPV